MRGSSHPGDQLCATLEWGGGGCTAIDPTKQIQLFFRDEGKGRNVLWGILADDVRAVRIRYANDSTRREDARRAFGALGRVESVTALGGKGNELGTVSADGFAPMGCREDSCYITFHSSY